MTEVREEIENNLKIFISHMTPKSSMKKVMDSSRGEAGVLLNLSIHPAGLQPNELAKILHVGSGRIGNVIKAMKKKNYINEKQLENDKRNYLITMTDKGLEAYQKYYLDFQKHVDFFAKSVGENALLEFTRTLLKFMDVLAHTEVNVND